MKVPAHLRIEPTRCPESRCQTLGRRRGLPARLMLQDKLDRFSRDHCLSRPTFGRGRLSAMSQGKGTKRATGATPLIAVAAAAVDTETTGLDATNARVVQIGAVGIARGRVVREHQFNPIVDPGEAIPSEASRVHGITDADVAGA